VLAIPGQIVEIADEANRLARVDVAGVRRTINIGLLDEDGGGVGRRLGPDPCGLRHLAGGRGGAIATRRQLERMGENYEAELEELKASVIEVNENACGDHCITCSDEGIPMHVERVDDVRGLALCAAEDGSKSTVRSRWWTSLPATACSFTRASRSRS
jgi:hydrogenase expression/formation protein HypC